METAAPSMFARKRERFTSSNPKTRSATGYGNVSASSSAMAALCRSPIKPRALSDSTASGLNERLEMDRNEMKKKRRKIPGDGLKAGGTSRMPNGRGDQKRASFKENLLQM